MNTLTGFELNHLAIACFRGHSRQEDTVNQGNFTLSRVAPDIFHTIKFANMFLLSVARRKTHTDGQTNPFTKSSSPAFAILSCRFTHQTKRYQSKNNFLSYPYEPGVCPGWRYWQVRSYSNKRIKYLCTWSCWRNTLACPFFIVLQFILYWIHFFPFCAYVWRKILQHAPTGKQTISNRLETIG